MNGRRISKKVVLYILIVALLLGISPLGYVPAAYAEEPPFQVNAHSAILVEASTGKILYKKNIDEPRPPASMTKMMTELLVWEAIEQKKISWDQKVKTSEYAFYMGKYGGSRVYLNLGAEHSIQELYEAMAIYSANDATVLLAETIAGTEENFVKMMNDKAKELGMKNTHFLTSTGFPADELGEFRPNIEGEHFMSARDSAILARELITRYPDALKISSIPKKPFQGDTGTIEMANWNWMLPGLVNEYPGVDGLKTGNTDEAKYCFTGTAQRNGIRFITVVMGAETIQSRFEETRKLLDYAFANYQLKTLVPKGEKVKGFEEAEVKKGVDLTVPAVVEEALAVPVKAGEEELFVPKVAFQEVTAPLEKGQVVGTATYEYKGEEPEEYLRPQDQQDAGVKLIAEQEVEKASWIRLFFRGIKNFFSGIFSGIADSIKK